jgi:hypothetical protein
MRRYCYTESNSGIFVPIDMKRQSRRYETSKSHCTSAIRYTAISIKVVPEQSGKVEYERERLQGIAKKFINLLAIPTSLSRLYSTIPLCSGTTLIN